MNILVKNTYREADITITKNIYGDENPDQSFIFLIENAETKLSMQVAIPADEFNEGTASITIKDLSLRRNSCILQRNNQESWCFH